MAEDPKLLLWVDLETTGTDENADGIMEVASIITTVDLREIAWLERAVQLEPGPYRRLTENQFVWQMHQDNGLTDECVASIWTVPEVDRELALLLRNHGSPHDYMLAGSGVGHFDFRFLRRHLPRVTEFLQYPALDMGVIRRALRFWGGPTLDFGTNEGKEHRAMADIQQHLSEAKTYRSLFQNVADKAPWTLP